MAKMKPLARGEIEITWMTGQVERVQTKGQHANGATIVMDMGDHKVIIPVTSIRKLRVPSGTL